MNVLALLVASIVGMVIYSIYWGPLMGKQWMKAAGITKADMEKAKKKGMTVSYVLAFIGVVLTAYALSFLYSLTNLPMSGIFLVAFWGWLGFVVVIEMGKVLWEGKPWSLLFINSIGYLITFFVMAWILGAMA